ncbi:hypothetical protein K503DRAFT_424281 [Rhizopogon vinicolor AM-OR11-026]|uniref:F-box domain-containing protein n=1 Tax=Rhizopogon vinicolor AM-OR11-026 TaxID=1314800 RepID=A0A1B7MQ36_9AGAM|nr:hypothetical protein K503DRAFT_424281 [Rhizopogon vinicolor AM-OR11-026]
MDSFGREAQLAWRRDGEELLRISPLGSLQAEIGIQQEKRRAVPQPRIFLNRAHISPVRSLPIEILQRIFTVCLPNERRVKPDIQSASLLLCQICWRWREVAEATSEPWSSSILRLLIIEKRYSISQESM